MKLTLQKAIEVLKNRDNYAPLTLKRAAKYILEHRNSRKVTNSLLTLSEKLAISKLEAKKTLSKSTKVNEGSKLRRMKSLVQTITPNRQTLLDAFNPTHKPRKIFELLLGKYKQSGWFQYLFVVWLIFWYLFSAAFLTRILMFFEIFRFDYDYYSYLFKNANLADYFKWVKDWSVIPSNHDLPLTGIHKTMAETDPISGEYHRNVDQKEYEIYMHKQYIEQLDRVNKSLEELSKTSKPKYHGITGGGLDSYYYDFLDRMKDKYQQGIYQYERYGLFKQYYDTYHSWKSFFSRWIGYPLSDLYDFFTSYEGLCYLVAILGVLYGSYALMCYYDIDMATVLACMGAVVGKIYSGAHYVVVEICHIDTAIIWLHNKFNSLMTRTGIFDSVSTYDPVRDEPTSDLSIEEEFRTSVQQNRRIAAAGDSARAEEVGSSERHLAANEARNRMRVFIREENIQARLEREDQRNKGLISRVVEWYSMRRRAEIEQEVLFDAEDDIFVGDNTLPLAYAEGGESNPVASGSGVEPVIPTPSPLPEIDRPTLDNLPDVSVRSASPINDESTEPVASGSNTILGMVRGLRPFDRPASPEYDRDELRQIANTLVQLPSIPTHEPVELPEAPSHQPSPQVLSAQLETDNRTEYHSDEEFGNESAFLGPSLSNQQHIIRFIEENRIPRGQNFVLGSQRYTYGADGVASWAGYGSW